MKRLKACSKCGIPKELDQFSWKNKSKGVRQSLCKKCHASYRKSHYQQNKSKYLDQAKAHYERTKMPKHKSELTLDARARVQMRLGAIEKMKREMACLILREHVSCKHPTEDIVHVLERVHEDGSRDVPYRLCKKCGLAIAIEVCPTTLLRPDLPETSLPQIEQSEGKEYVLGGQIYTSDDNLYKAYLELPYPCRRNLELALGLLPKGTELYQDIEMKIEQLKEYGWE